MKVHTAARSLALIGLVVGVLLPAVGASARAACEFNPSQHSLRIWVVPGSEATLSLVGHGRFRLGGDRTSDCDGATTQGVRRVTVNGGDRRAETFVLDNRGSGGPFPASLTFRILLSNGGPDSLVVRGSNDSDVISADRDARRLIVEMNGAMVDARSVEVAQVFLGAGNDRFSGDGEGARGGPGNDRLTGPDLVGGTGSDVLTGTGGADLLAGGSGQDQVRARGGDDELEGGAGRDEVDGGAGADAMIWARERAGVQVNVPSGSALTSTGRDSFTGIEVFVLSTKADTFAGGPGAEFVRTNDGSDRVDGGGGDDEIDGSGGEDTLRGGDGADQISGGNREDRLLGGAGDDELEGGQSDDSLIGGPGSDAANGGPGVDTCDAEITANCEP